MTIQFLRKYGTNTVGGLVARDLGVGDISVCNNGRLSRQGAEIDPEAILFNYGIAGQRWFAMLDRNPVMRTMTIMNPWQQINKLQWIDIARNAGINVPESLHSGRSFDDTWLAKPYYSKGGRGILIASEEHNTNTHYYQKIVPNRKYELRVVFFTWDDPKNWLVWKRIMKTDKDQITWNYHQGGTFVWVNHPNDHNLFVRAKNDVSKLINVCHLSFGAVDFIVDTDNQTWFIEVNTCPGFTSEENRGRYVESFRKLLNISTEG